MATQQFFNPTDDSGKFYDLVSPTESAPFADLLKKALGSVPTEIPSFQSMLSQGVSSPLLQTILAPALSNLVQGEDRARTALTDQFRAAGGLGGGAYGVAVPQLEGQLQQQRGNLISQVLSSFLPTVASGLNQDVANQFRVPAMLLQALQAIQPNAVTKPGTGSQSQSIGGAISDPFGMLGPQQGLVPGSMGDPFRSFGGGVSHGEGWNLPGGGGYTPPAQASQTGFPDLLSALSGSGSGGTSYDPLTGFFNNMNQGLDLGIGSYGGYGQEY